MFSKTVKSRRKIDRVLTDLGSLAAWLVVQLMLVTGLKYVLARHPYVTWRYCEPTGTPELCWCVYRLDGALIYSTVWSCNEKRVVNRDKFVRAQEKASEKEENSCTAERLEEQPSSPHCSLLG